MKLWQIEEWRDIVWEEKNRRQKKIQGTKYSYRFLTGGHFFFVWWDCLQQATCDIRFGKKPGSTYAKICGA